MEQKVKAILDGLNEEQANAVQSVEGPVIIVAGAGSGKTRVLTSRVAYILAQGVDPARVLALTFTKKAAGEMKERIGLMVGPSRARRVVMGTFHAVFVRFLRTYAGSLGYPENFTIYDTSDSTSAIKAIIKDLGLDDKIYKPKEVLGKISSAKNNLWTPAAYRGNADMMRQDTRSGKGRIADIYQLYQDRMKQSGVMDFDDILLNMNILFRDNKEALSEIASRFSYIMVDEYQDTNYSQYIILKKLASMHRNICVVGDDSQSIYAFRGAKIENILKFQKDYPESRIFRLERNYRSTTTIVDAANSVIAHNTDRIPKNCYSKGERGDLINILHAYSEGEEALLIVSSILDRLRNDHASYKDFAVLYRTNSQSRIIEENLRRRNIPYIVYSGNAFFDRAEVKDLMAYFKLCVNPNDDESFKRIVNKPARAIGETTVSALNECARRAQCSLFKAVYSPEMAASGLKAATIQKLVGFCDMISRLGAKVPVTDAYDLARQIAEESGLYAFYKSDTSVEGQARSENVEELLNAVLAFVEDRKEEADMELPDGTVFTLDDYLENAALLSNVDVNEDDANNRVAIMTVHAAKGLEYPYVYVAGLEENLFPSSLSQSSLKDLEEERRLFYVAVTRAEKAVTLSYSSSRMRNGKTENNAPSRFIKEIDSKYIENPLSDDDFSAIPVSRESSFRGFGSRFSGSSSQGGKVTVTRVSAAQAGLSRPGAPRPGMPSSRPAATLGVKQPVKARPAQVSALKPAVIDPNFQAVPMTELYDGERIEHNRFGAGTIKTIEGVIPDLKAIIDFDDYGLKTILLKYAKLRPVKK